MTRGRRREHYQWNMDLWGVPGVDAEAELIAAVFALLDRLGLAPGDVKVRVSSRRLLEALVRERRAAPERFAPVCVVVDKLGKIGAEAVLGAARDPAARSARARPGARSWSTSSSVRDLAEARRAPARRRGARRSTSSAGSSSSSATTASPTAWCSTPRSCAGLAYYTGVVFEAFDAAGELRAVCGGGRYDRLLESLGGKAAARRRASASATP